jgi:meso-butanediol dehydrogenase/(S,S)-butanediol dehydrogenase/diacetyl reductase
VPPPEGRGREGLDRRVDVQVVLLGVDVERCEAGDEEPAQATADAFGREALGVPADVRNREQTAARIATAVERWRRLGVMSNNAGVYKPQNFLDATTENWGLSMDVDGWGVMVGMQEAAKRMGAREFAKHDVTVNSFAPGVVDTPLWETLDEQLMELGVSDKKGQAMKDFSAGILRGRPATPADIVGVTTYLASPESDYMTGQTLMIDGGIVLI